jgi:hypothetical protein
MSGHSVASPEARLPPPPRDRLPAPPEVRIPAREDVRIEVQPEVRAPAPKGRPVSSVRPGDRAPRRGPSSRQLLRQVLSSPSTARQGVLLREVLGPPVSLRTDAHDRPT